MDVEEACLGWAGEVIPKKDELVIFSVLWGYMISVLCSALWLSVVMLDILVMSMHRLSH